MAIQRGIAPVLRAKNAISDAIGKAVCYDTVAGKVVEGSATDAQHFAGIIFSVASGAEDAAAGDALTVENDMIVEVSTAGAVSPRDFLTLGANGTFATATFTSPATTAELLGIVGRALTGIDKAGKIQAMIWVRK